MTSTLRRQLAEIGMEHRWHDILEEIPRVREELGWPIMVTPLSQFVGVQAFLNVTERRALVAAPGRGDPLRAGPVRAAGR